MSDIVTRLRSQAPASREEADAEIERLQARVAELLNEAEALRRLSSAAGFAAAREMAAEWVDCGCAEAAAVRAAETKADRWRACPRDPCGAEDAAAIRALRPDGDA